MVRSSDIDCARAGLTDAFLPVELSVKHVRPAIDVQLNVVDVGRTTVGFLRFGDAVRIRTADATNYHIDIPVAGTMVAKAGRDDPLLSTTRKAAIFMPFRPADLDCDRQCAQLCLMLARTDVHTEVENLLGRSIANPPTFAATLDLHDPQGGALLHVLRLIDLESRRVGGLLTHRLAAQRMEQILLDVLIFGQGHSFSEAIRADQPAAGNHQVSRAVELMRDSPEQPWTVGSLAAAISVSTRSLHDSFRRHMGTSPMAYLRDLRLRAVRDELATAEPGSVTVAEAAGRWGFVHLGRFAASYRQRFAELPSATLASARPSDSRVSRTPES